MFGDLAGSATKACIEVVYKFVGVEQDFVLGSATARDCLDLEQFCFFSVTLFDLFYCLVGLAVEWGVFCGLGWFWAVLDEFFEIVVAGE